MSDPARRGPEHLTVIKIGGSVLTDPAAYRRAAEFLARRVQTSPGSRILAIVSAERGLTDALLASARDLAPDPDPETLDLLWSTGEIRSVALLVLALQTLGVKAAAANIHQTGLVSRRSPTNGDGWRSSGVRPLRLKSILADAAVVVAPGFLARTAGDRIASLGRGGSDLSAVLFAAGLGAQSCELLKDVPGYFTADPNTSACADHLETLGYDEAIGMAGTGCDLVQLGALEAARDLNVRLRVRALDDTLTTVVG